MAYRLALEAPDMVRGVAAIAATNSRMAAAIGTIAQKTAVLCQPIIPIRKIATVGAAASPRLAPIVWKAPCSVMASEPATWTSSPWP